MNKLANTLKFDYNFQIDQKDSIENGIEDKMLLEHSIRITIDHQTKDDNSNNKVQRHDEARTHSTLQRLKEYWKMSLAGKTTSKFSIDIEKLYFLFSIMYLYFPQ